MHPRSLAPRPGAFLPALLGTFAAAALSALVPAQISQSMCLPQSHMGTVDDAEAHHVLNRLTFGPTTDLLNAVEAANGYVTFVQQQLVPTGITENGDLATIRAQLNLPFGTIPWDNGTLINLDGIRMARIAQAMLSKRQLNEVMTEFWENHFNTDFNRLSLWITKNVTGPSGAFPGQDTQHMQCWMEWTQNEMFRANALGTFEDLLKELITSPAMMVYLDSVYSTCTAANEPNENFARELLELYSMGQVDASTGQPNYDQSDIDKVADLLSGWGLVSTGPFPYYVAQETTGQHCGAAQTLFPSQVPIPAGNAQQQRDALAAALANHPPVKDFICRKIVRQFVADEAALPGVEDGLLGAMKLAWGAHGDIAAVLCTLTSHPVFQGSDYRWRRVRSPLERVTWNARVWDSLPTSLGPVSAASLVKPLEDVADLGQALFAYITPDGFPLDSVERLGSSTTLEGVIAGADVYRGVKPAVDNLPGGPPPAAAWALSQTPLFVQYVQSKLTAAQQANPGLVARVILTRLYPGAWTATDQAAVATALGTNLNPSSLPAYTVDLARGIAVAFSFNNATLK